MRSNYIYLCSTYCFRRYGIFFRSFLAKQVVILRGGWVATFFLIAIKTYSQSPAEFANATILAGFESAV